MSKPRSHSQIFRIGAQGAALLVVIQAILGIAIAQRYDATIAGANASVANLRSDSLWKIVLSAHYWGSALAILLGGLMVATMVFAGWYRSKPGTWLGALLFAASALALQLTGNLLPFDRHDVQTVVIEAGVAGRTPLIGDFAQRLMLQGDQFGEQTLQGWYLAHRWVFTVGIALGALMLMAGNWTRKGSNWLVLAPALLSFVVGLILPAPFGPAATQADFSLQDAVASWYAWPLHGALIGFESMLPGCGWIGSALLPTLFGGFLLFLPILGKKVARGVIVALFLAFVIGFGVLGAAYGGRPAPIAGLQDVPGDPELAVNPNHTPRPAEIDRALATKGQDFFNSFACVGCHGANGAGGKSAPNLTKVWDRHPDPEWFRRFIRNPGSVKPGSVMPGFGSLEEARIDALVEWFRSMAAGEAADGGGPAEPVRPL